MSASPWRSSPRLLLLLVVVFGSAKLSAGDGSTSQPPPLSAAASNGSAPSHNSALDPVYYIQELFIEQLYRNIRVKPIDDVARNIAEYDAWSAVQLILAAVASLAACVIVGILFCVIMPITGLCCCCCRMCGKCGGKAPLMDPPRAKCKRVSCGFSLLALTTLMLGAAVVTFLSTEEIYKQLQTDGESAVSRYNPTMHALMNALNVTLEKPAEAVKNINSSFGRILDVSSGSIFRSLSNVPMDFVPLTLAGLRDANGSISSALAELATIRTAMLNITQLNLARCCAVGSNCTVVSNRNYSEFDSETLQSSPAIANTTDALLKASEAYTQLQEGIAQSITSAKTATASTLDKLHEELQSLVRVFDSQKVKGSATLSEGVRDAIADYSKYVRIGGFALGAIVALIVLLLYLGLCCGLCGRRAGDDSSSCSKGSGAKSLLAAVGLMFIFSWLLMLVTMILFPMGSLQLACWLVDETQDTKFEVMSEVRISGVDATVNITVGTIDSSIRDCRSKSVYSILIAYVPEVDAIVTNLTDKGKWGVDDLKQSMSSVDIQLPPNIDSTVNDLTSVNDSLHRLLDAVERLQALVLQKPLFPDPSDVSTNLNSSSQCDTDRKQFEAQASAVTTARSRLQQLATDLRQQLGGVVQSTEAARVGITWLRSNVSGSGSVTLPTTIFDGIVWNLTTVVNETVQQLKDYPCNPLYRAVKNVADLFCESALDPVNALWFSLGWSTALFVPIIILALCLVSLYRREEPYKSRKDGRDYQEYEDDGVTIRDNVPLDNMPSRKSHYPYSESYLNAAYNGPHGDGRESVPPPYYGMYTGNGGAAAAGNGGHFPRYVPSPTNGDVTFGGPGPSVPKSQKRY